MKKDNSRRHFIKGAIIGSSALLVPSIVSAEYQLGDLPNADPKIFLFQGDSITDGNRGRNADPNHIMGHGYVFALASRIGADFPARGMQFYNRGISGHRVSDLLKRWQEDALALKPDLLSILVGINDTNAYVNSEDKNPEFGAFENTYRTLLQQSRDLNPDLQIVLSQPFIYPVGKVKEKWELWKTDVIKRKEIVLKLAKEFDAIIVDYHDVFEKASKKTGIEYWIWDGIHPTIFGHELMARHWINEVSKKVDFLRYYHQK